MPTTRHRRSAPPAQLAPSTDGSLRVVLIGDQNDEAALFRDAIDAHPGARLAAVVAPDPTRLRLRTTADDVPTLLTVQELFTRRFPADLLVNVHPKATPSTFMRDALRRGYSVFSNGPGNIGVAEFRKRLKQAGEANRAAVVLDPYRAMVTSALRLAGTDALRDGPLQTCFRDIHAGSQHFFAGELASIELGRRGLAELIHLRMSLRDQLFAQIQRVHVGLAYLHIGKWLQPLRCRLDHAFARIDAHDRVRDPL